MGGDDLDGVAEIIIAETADRVKELGFVRRGNALRKIGEENIGIIEFQKSVNDSKSKILFTVNLAVVCGALLDAEQSTLAKAKSIDAHLRQRIGMLMPGRPDKWWEVTNATDVDALATEVSDLIRNEGAPYINRYLSMSELVALWESGKSPGLTAVQRSRYLEKIKSRHYG
jgi:hypothetical protein